MTHPILDKLDEAGEMIGNSASLTALQAARHDHALRQLKKAIAADVEKAMEPETIDAFVTRFAQPEDAKQARDQGEPGYLPAKRASEATSA